MKALVLIVPAFLLMGCEGPKSNGFAKVGSPVEFKATGIDHELRLSLLHGLSGAGAVVPATKCPEIIVDGLIEENLSLECGALKVPQDHDDPFSKPMTLGYFKTPAVFDPVKPLLVIEQGGPGSSSIMLAAYYIFQTPELATHFNILAIEQRGTEWTYPDVTCSLLINEPNKAGVSKQDMIKKSSAIKRANAKCFENAKRKMDLSKISSYQIARDIIYGVDQMGFDQFNFHGVSYGSIVGQYLLNISPDKLLNVVLDSPVVPGKPWIEDSIKAKDSFYQKQFETFINDAFPEMDINSAIRYLNEAADKFERNEFVVEIGFDKSKKKVSVTRENFMDLVISSLHSGSFLFTSKLLEASDLLITNPSYSRLIIEPLLNLQAQKIDEKVSTTTLMYEKIICREFPYDMLDVKRATSAWTFLPEILDKNQMDKWTEDVEVCTLNLKKDDKQFVLSNPVETSKAVLVIGGEHDTITIPRYVEDVTVAMPYAHKKVYSQATHGVFGHKSCVNQSVLNFLKSRNGEFLDECEKSDWKSLF